MNSITKMHTCRRNSCSKDICQLSSSFVPSSIIMGKQVHATVRIHTQSRCCTSDSFQVAPHTSGFAPSASAVCRQSKLFSDSLVSICHVAAERSRSGLQETFHDSLDKRRAKYN